MDIKNLIEQWMSELQYIKHYSQHTSVAYKSDVMHFLKFFANHISDDVSIKKLNDAKTSDFRSWLSYRVKNNISARSNVRALSALKSFFFFLSKLNLVDLQAISAVKRPKIDSLLPKPIQVDSLLKFLNAPYYFENDPEWITKRDSALFTLLYCAGLRISEALNLTYAEIDENIKIKGKGKKDRIVVLLPIAIDKIRQYVAACPFDLSNSKLFVGNHGKCLFASYVDGRLSKLRAIHHLPNNASAHSFRHSFASHMMQNGADMRTVQELLGHESLSSTQIYTEIDDMLILKTHLNCHPLNKK